MRLVLAQFNYTVGDFAGNVAKMLELYQEHADSADLVVFTELAITGYYPMDLLTQPAFLADQERALIGLREATRGRRAALLSGFVDENQGPGKAHHNALAIFRSGRTAYTYHKRLLPTYNIFEEARHFEPGDTPGVYELGGVRIGLAICEDLWNDQYDYDYDHVPLRDLREAKVAFVLSINASPSHLGKQAERIARFSGSARRHKLPLIYLNQVGGNDEIVFDGNSCIFDETGKYRFGLAPFAEDVGLVDIASDGMLIDMSSRSERSSLGDESPSAFFHAQIVLGLRDYARKCGFKQVVVGSSGGIDSALTLALAVDALGPSNVLALTMPSRFSSSGSVDDSVDLCRNLGIELRHASIEAQFAQAVADFSQCHQVAPSELTQQNIQARLRGRMLMEVTNHFHNLLLSTGNKSEMSVGYATLYGDMNGGLNLIGDLYKMEVYALSNWLNENSGRARIPQVIIDKEPSAELSPGQKDSDALPPYPVLDAILRLAIEGAVLKGAERLALQQFLAPVELASVTRVLKLIARAEFKRRQAPPIIRLQRRAFGLGWRMPIAQAYVLDAWTLLGRAQA